ncbi:MAG: sensor histidine kinase [Emcibacteraceae bacterium]|nr:sensor histidine kinase [Emcibacteraceae bacterium]MDG1997412.1 sensor histidine kinase [Emcibacteraceae bacterium]
MSSLKARLNFGVFLVSLIFFSTLMAVNIFLFNSFGESFVETRLQHDTDALLANLSLDENEQLSLDEVSLNPIFLQPFSGYYFIIEMDHRTYLSRSLWDQSFNVSQLALGEKLLHEVNGPVEQILLVLEGTYQKDGQLIRIAVAEDYTPVGESLKSLTIVLALLNGGIVLLLMVIQRFIVTRGMEPLQKTTEELSAIGTGDKDFLDEKVPEEVLPLVKEINQLMVIVDNRIKRSTTALGNLAHALKTPLSLIEQSASSDEVVNASKDIIDATKQIKLQLDSELKRARIIGSTGHGQKIDLEVMLKPLTDTLQKIYQHKEFEFILDIAPHATYVGDKHDMMELFGNLLDNACKWAKNTIHISITEDLYVIVEDDGPGISKEKLEQIEKRGIRLDEAGEGHGLGLSIVREIVDLTGADISYGSSEKYGGLKVSIKMKAS